jgi:hypothetical protein
MRYVRADSSAVAPGYLPSRRHTTAVFDFLIEILPNRGEDGLRISDASADAKRCIH